MHFATLITLILVSLLILSVRLLFTFSYITFIPLYIEFGIYVYFATIFIIYLGSKYYLYKTINSSDKKLDHFTYVALPALLSFGIAISILFTFEIPTNYNGIGEGGLAAAYTSLFKFIILFFIASAISVLLFISANLKFNVGSFTSSFPLNNFLKNSAIFVIPVLTVAIVYTLFLAYSDFNSTGIKHGYSNKSNRSTINQKVIEKQDITFCDYIINTYDTEYSIEDCYLGFFESNEKIRNFNKLRKVKNIINRNDFSDITIIDDNSNLTYLKRYINLYNQIEKKCSRSKRESLCEKIFHEKTELILDPLSGFQIIFDGKKPTYILINVSNIPTYSSDIHNLLVEDLEYLSDEYISVIKKSPNNDSLTEIHLHLEKLTNNPDKLKEIRQIISARKQNLLIAFKQKQKKIEKEAKLKRQKEKQKLIELRFEFISDMRLKFKLKPDDDLDICQINEPYTCVCSIPMCINDKFIYNYPRIFDRVFIGTEKYLASSVIPESTMLRCLINYKEGKPACNGFTEEDNDIRKTYTMKERMALRKRIKSFNNKSEF